MGREMPETPACAVPMAAAEGREGQQLGRRQVRCHVGEFEARALEAADGLPELFALGGPTHGGVQHAPSAADAGGGQEGTAAEEISARHRVGRGMSVGPWPASPSDIARRSRRSHDAMAARMMRK
jgi:hypothetical protein